MAFGIEAPFELVIIESQLSPINRPAASLP